jgi:subtilase family serine protease
MVARSARRRALRATVAIAAVAATITGVGVASSAEAEASTRVSFASAVPSWATKANATGSTPSKEIIEGEIFLKLHNRNGAVALATAVSDPSSSSYRRYVTPQQWISAFSPSQQTFDAAVADIRAKGLTVTGSPASRQYVVFRGTVAAVDEAFSTTMAAYRVRGHRLLAPSTAPSLSARSAARIAGISLDQSRLLTRPASASRTDAETAGSRPRTLASPRAAAVTTRCSAYIRQRAVTFPAVKGTGSRIATANCGYTPKQLRAVYGTGIAAGAGQTVAIVDAYSSPSIVPDVNTYARRLGEPLLTAGQYVDRSALRSTFTDQASCGYASGWQGEQTLDVQAVHAIAPKAGILYVGGANCGGGMDIALSTILDNGLATIVSNSYGGVGEPTGSGAGAYITGELNLQLQAAAEGIGLYFASGDDGDEKANLGYTSADFPASSPWVTAVGGTAIGISRSDTRIFSIGWGDTLNPVYRDSKGRLAYRQKMPGTLFMGGSGGGRTRIAAFAQPAYQRGAVPTSLSRGLRTAPDVAALADPFTGFLVGYRPITNSRTLATGAFDMSVSGGTSLAAPIVAAQMAVIQQISGARVGFANPALYSVAKTSPKAFIDIRPRGSRTLLAYATSSTSYLATLDTDSSLRTRVGYDTVTGLGELRVSSARLFRTPNR